MEIWEYFEKRRKPEKVSNAAEMYSKMKMGVPLDMEGGRILVML